MNVIKVGGACLNQTPIDWRGNVKNILDAIDSAKAEKIEILCLSELSITAYGCQDLFLHQWVAAQALQELKTIIPHTKGISVALGLPLWYEGKCFNCIALVSDGQILGFYAKQFLANDGIHYEKRWFEPWPKETLKTIEIEGQNYPLGDQVFEIGGLKVGFEICEDAWRNDRPACRLYEKGVQLILNPSASHFAFKKVEKRESLVINSSKSFECTYLYVNQLGNESGRVIYDGDILIANRGKLHARNKRFSFERFNLQFVEIENSVSIAASAENQHHQTSLEEFAPAVGLALFDYLRKSGAKGYVLSLSGGADSSSIAVLVSEMVKLGILEIGFDRFCQALRIDSSEFKDKSAKSLVHRLLFTAYQGTVNSSEATLQSARELASSIGAQFKAWNLDNILKETRDTVEHVIERPLSWEQDDIALQNIQARSRSPIIWMLANIKGAILLTTSNRSEGDVGYTTMDGDTSGSLAPIAGVDKSFILSWLKYAQLQLSYQGLQYVNSLTPTAELRPLESTQTDEDDLMPYDILRDIEHLGIYQMKSPTEVYEELKCKLSIDSELLKQYIRKFYRLWSINQWKRERLAPSFHVDEFNVDPKTWCRFPILSSGFEKELEELV